MTDLDCKLLTEFLGQCAFLKADNRTFTTPDDMMAVKDKLVEKGLWKKFYWWVVRRYEIESVDDPWKDEDFPAITDWLINPERFYELAVEFLKESREDEDRDDMFQLLEDRDKEN
jgi:hypothetical protein